MTARELWQWAVENGEEDTPLWAGEYEGADERDSWRPLGVYQPVHVDYMDLDWWAGETPIYNDDNEEKLVVL